MNPKALLAFSFVSFALVILIIGTPPALAQNCSAKTCSEAIQACTGMHCQRERTGGRGDCTQLCRTEFERCMQTGEFRGRVCQRTGLKKK
jgi:hypothetical protein